MVERGYINSQSWQAWRNSFQVLWDNTELFYIVSLSISLAIVLLTWVYTRRLQNRNFFAETAVEGKRSGPLNDKVQESLGINPSLNLAKALENQMTEEDKILEKEAQAEQLTAIFSLMQEQEEKFGNTSIDDLKEQMKFYCG